MENNNNLEEPLEKIIREGTIISIDEMIQLLNDMRNRGTTRISFTTEGTVCLEEYDDEGYPEEPKPLGE